MNYINEVFDRVKARNSAEPEFLQAVEEVFHSLAPVLEKHPEWVEANILDRIAEPERQIIFRVPWVDDNGDLQSVVVKVDRTSTLMVNQMEK